MEECGMLEQREIVQLFGKAGVSRIWQGDQRKRVFAPPHRSIEHVTSSVSLATLTLETLSNFRPILHASATFVDARTLADYTHIKT
jgi:hypothetical protein